MPAIQERYYDMLIRRIREDDYPSPQLLDRVEASFWTPEQFLSYVELLVDKADRSRYMSPQLLDRIHRLLARAAAA
ncbi:MAG TPA: hypothetical protein VFN55_01555 [Solirubrobacteraceae bacterium]|nr:hypothetical protein [Solirubrobacteraceae bacterium]